jgi:hypothetical protein
MVKTEFIVLTEMWHDCLYNEIGDVMVTEQWTPAEVAEFCAYFMRYVGTKPLEILYKFL